MLPASASMSRRRALGTSVRSSVVCLLPTQKGLELPEQPFVYLGQVGGTRQVGLVSDSMKLLGLL